MRITINSSISLGQAIRAVRRHSRVRLDDLAATAGLSKQFTSDVERGKPTVQLGRVLKLLAELGIVFELDIPAEAMPELSDLQRKSGGEADMASKKATPDPVSAGAVGVGGRRGRKQRV